MRYGLTERLLIGLVAANLAVLLADLLYNLLGALGGLTPAP
jgi:hypothetical protein